MGKYGKYFCMGVPDILICIGTFMFLLNGVAVSLNFLCFFTMIDDAQNSDGLTQPGKTKL